MSTFEVNAAVDHRRARPDELGEGDEEEGLGVLLGQRPGERDRTHRPGQGERGGHHRLAIRGHLDEAVRHRAVEAERRVRIDDGHQARLAGEPVAVDAAGEADHLDGVVDRPGAEAEAVPRLVEEGR